MMVEMSFWPLTNWSILTFISSWFWLNLGEFLVHSIQITCNYLIWHPKHVFNINEILFVNNYYTFIWDN